MPKMELAGQMHEVDAKGYLQETDKWTEDIARAYALKEGVTELTPDHWKILNYLRIFQLTQFNTPPFLAITLARIGKTCSLKYLENTLCANASSFIP